MLTMSTPSRARRTALACAVLLASVLAGCSDPAATPPAAEPAGSTATAAHTPSIIPAPARLETREGRFVVDGGTLVTVDGAGARDVALVFTDLLTRAGGVSLVVSERVLDAATPAIRFKLDATLAQPEEGYVLDIDANGATLVARSAHGLFNGTMTLWQLLVDGRSGDVVLPALHIEDAPRFSWRGLMLDSARHMQSVDDIKRLLDAMAQHKFNTLHWHLTDDQGWRIEIAKYPKLTEVGGCRIPLGDAGRDPATGAAQPYCGFYTKAQIRDVVAYAAARHITIVPEFDLPGHARAAVAAYPELGVLDVAEPVSAEWGIHTTLFNVEEATLTFIEDVFAEIIELFPGAYIHVGGDEAAKDQWKASPRVQARMKELGIADEAGLQSWFITRMETFLAAKGRKLIGWDEILEGGLPATATVMSWRGTEGGIAAARHGNDVVMAPHDRLYFDYLQSDSPEDTPGRPTANPLRTVYDYEPVPTELTPEQAKHILGAQANLWTEHLRTAQRVERSFFPRAAALAEVTWSPVARRDWSNFLARLPAQFERYRVLGIDASTVAFDARASVRSELAAGKATVTLANQVEQGEIRYTLDGSEPTAASLRYDAPIDAKVADGSTLHARTFLAGEPFGHTLVQALDTTSLRRRANHELPPCKPGLPLRLEDDTTIDGTRGVFTIDIFNPCWRYADAELDGITTLHVRAVRVPYAFQLWHDEPHRKFVAAKSTHGEFEVRAGCEGDVIGKADLPADTGPSGILDLDVPLTATAGRHDLCMIFTGDTRPATWVVAEAALK